MNVDARARLDTAVHQRLVERNVRVANLHVLAHHADVDHRFGILLRRDHGAPLGQIRGRDLEAQLVDHDVVQVLFMQQHGNFIDIVGIDRGYHRAFLHVGEQSDLAPLLVRQPMGTAAQQDIRLNTDAAQLLHRVLRGLGLDLAGTAHDGHQGQMHVEHVAAPQFGAHLPDGLEERQRFDVAHRAADFDHAYIGVARAHAYAVLDLIGDVRNHLHGRAQIIAAALLGDDALVDAARGEVAVAAGGGAHEALVMSEIEIRLGAVRGDEYFAMLKRTHGARIHVDVGIQLHHADLEPACFENGAQRGGGDALAQRGNHAAGDENKSCHDGVTAD